MIKLNTYISEAWSGVKKQSYEQEIKSWCEEMDIGSYTINSKGEIDVYGGVYFNRSTFNAFEELPYKFGKVDGWFSLENCRNLISLKNCPNEVGGYFSCSYNKKLKSLEGCPNEVGGDFYCRGCKREFTKEYIKSLCKVNGNIVI